MTVKLMLKAFLGLGVLSGLFACGSELSNNSNDVYKSAQNAPTISRQEANEIKTTGGTEASAPAAAPADPDPPKRPSNPRRLYQLSELDTVKIKIGKHEWVAWVMDDTSKKAEGMMFLENSEFTEKEAMVFVYNEPIQMNFWMKNTLVDLDIAFVDAARRIVSTATMKALDETLVPSKKPAQYAIEFKKGVMKKFEIRPGQEVQFSKPLKALD